MDKDAFKVNTQTTLKLKVKLKVALFQMQYAGYRVRTMKNKVSVQYLNTVASGTSGTVALKQITLYDGNTENALHENGWNVILQHFSEFAICTVSTFGG